MGDSLVIYLDVVFAINLIMDWLILWSVAHSLGLSFVHWRLVAGAFIGALYAVMLLLPPLSIVTTFVAKILFSLIIVSAAFPWQSWRLYCQILGCFYLISFVAGGAVLGVLYLVQDMATLANYNGVLALINLPVSWLLVGGVTLVLASVVGASWFRRYILKSRNSVLATVCFGEERISTTALVDTGNHLRDPISQRPVMVMEYSLLKRLLPKELDSLLQASEEPDWDRIVTALRGTPWEVRVRILPYHSLGRRQGMLLGLVPDKVYLVSDKNMAQRRNMIVGVYHGSLCPERKYQALLPPELPQMDLGAGKGVAS